MNVKYIDYKVSKGFFMYCNTKKQGSMMGMAMMGSCATRQMMDKSSKMRKFGMKKNSEDSEMS